MSTTSTTSTKSTASRLAPLREKAAMARFLGGTNLIAVLLRQLEDQITSDRLHLWSTKMDPELQTLRTRLNKIIRLAKECPF